MRLAPGQSQNRLSVEARPLHGCRSLRWRCGLRLGAQPPEPPAGGRPPPDPPICVKRPGGRPPGPPVATRRSQLNPNLAIALCLAFTLIVLAGCRREAPPSPDLASNLADLGTFAPPMRVVSLAPNVTELVFALGAGDRLVGVTRFCDWPPEALPIAKVGGFIDPSIETIVGLAPDLVVAMTNSGSKDAVAALERYGIRTLWLRIDDLEGTRQSFAILGQALGVESRAKSALAAFDAAIAAETARIPAGRPKPRTLITLDHRPLVVAGPGTFVDDLVRLAGGVNAAGGAKVSYPQWSAEALLEEKPEVIVDAWMGSADDDAVDRWRQMTTIPAVRDGRLYRWRDPRILRPGPRLPGALHALVDLLWGTPSER